MSEPKPSVVTIGNFDGVHAGHRHIMRRVVEIARQNHWTPIALTFDPHPTRLVAPDRAPRLLSTMEQRSELMRQEGIEEVEILPFTRDVANLTPEEFVRSILVDKLRARAVLVGENFRFGHRAAGNIETLRDLGVKYGFCTEAVTPVLRRNIVVSSSEVRRLIELGDVSKACRLLERPYELEGRVVAGQGVGFASNCSDVEPRCGGRGPTGHWGLYHAHARSRWSPRMGFHHQCRPSSHLRGHKLDH